MAFGSRGVSERLLASEQPSRRMRWGSAAALLGSVAAAVLLVAQHGHRLRESELAFRGQEGMLTRMINGRGSSLHDQRVAPSRMTQLSGLESKVHHMQLSDASDQAWAQQLLATGSSSAEQDTETDLVDGSNYATRDYANQRPGYTSVIPEGSNSPDDSAYEMARKIDEHREQVKMQGKVSRNDDDASRYEVRQSTSSQLYNYQPERRHAAQHRGGMKLHLAPFTSAVSESDKAGSADSSANAWASKIFSHEHERQMRAQPGIRSTQLADISSSQMFQSQAPTSSLAAGPLERPFTSSVREGPALHDEKAWNWASDMMMSHRLEMQRRSVVAKSLASVAPQKPATAAAKRMAAKLRRKVKLQAARKAIGDVHQSSQQDEIETFEEDRKEEQLRVKQIAAREKAEQQAADEGAREESQEYRDVLS